GQAAAVRQVLAAVGIGALVEAGPEKLVDEVAVRAVQLQAVEAQALGIGRGPAKGGDGIRDVVFRHGVALGLAGHHQARRAFKRLRRRPARAVLLHHAHVPELRADFAAAGVHFGGHVLPAGQRLLAVEVRNIGVVGGSG
nr:hypothetical protein [Tanacetum cinerariifolium]